MPGVIAHKARQFRRDEGGNLTVLMGIALLAVAMAAGAGVDYARLLSSQTALAAAVDAAALQLGTSKLKSRAALESLAESVVRQNYSEDRHGTLTDVELDLSSAMTVGVTVTAQLDTSFMRLAGIEHIRFPVRSEVTKSGSNIEVALVLDTTGSMEGTKISALKTAAKDFIDEVVWDDQSTFYSKVALVPYSMGVNLGSRAAGARGTATSGTCTSPGCTNYRFTNARGASRTLGISTCVSERTGTEALTDAAASSHPVGRNYASANNPCLGSELIALETDKTDLKNAVDALQASGSTAGQIGIAWGWYVLSRDFGLWSGSSQPAAYGADQVNKIAVIMTDGAFNTGYCRGVIARDSGTGSGSTNDKINCDATNGSSAEQAVQLCEAMKAKGITIYTVGFDIEDESGAQEVMTDCATSPAHAYLAATGAELKAAFREIGQKMTSIRISR